MLDAKYLKDRAANAAPATATPSTEVTSGQVTRRQSFLFRFRTQPTAHSFMRTLLSKRAHPERGRAVTPRSDFRFRVGNAASGGVRRACSQVRPPEGSVLAAGNWPGWEWPGRRDGRRAAAAVTLCQSGPGWSLWLGFIEGGSGRPTSLPA
ncbi:hypothetical protein ACRRTK_005793 [Alexandromys fortis]